MKTALLAFGLLLCLGAPGRAQSDHEALDPQALHQRGRERYDRRDYRGAIADYDAALRLTPDFAEALHSRGVARSRLKDWVGARADFEQTVDLRPDDSQAFFNLANARAMTGDLQAAIEAFDQAIRIDPEFVQALTSRANARAQLGDADGAIADCDEVIRLRPDHAEVFAVRGNARVKKGDLDGALADFDEALRLKPVHHAFSGRGKLRLERGDLEGARADFDASIPLLADCAACPRNRGEVRALQGDLDGARDDFETSSDVSGRDGRVGLWFVALGGDEYRLTRYMDRKDWMGSVTRYWLGQLTHEEMLAAALQDVTDADRPARLCDVHSIVGAHAEREGLTVLARESYRLCAETTGVERTFEFRFAKARLAALQ